MRSAKLAVAGLLAISSLAAPAATTITVTDLAIPNGTVRIATHRPDSPRANLIYLGGGAGVPDLQMTGDGANPLFFADIAYRSRQHFVDRGYSFTRVDSPGYLYPNGMDFDFRTSASTPPIIRAVLDHVLSKDNIPTWVLGHSAGAVSTINAALNLSAAPPFGVVLSSPPSYLPQTVVPNGVLDMNLEGVRLPTFVISHAQDTCVNTQPASSRLVASRLTGAAATAHVELTGGTNPPGDECGSTGFHSFGSLEAAYAAAIVDWTTKNAHLASTPNHTGLWYNFPAESESGWGINFTHEGNTVFATLFTYDSGGAPLWLVMSAGNLQSGSTYSGTLYRTRGPAFNASPFVWNPAADLSTVGTMTVNFTAADRATLTYTYNGVTVTKTIMKQVYGSRAANCVPTMGSRASLTHYQDLWYNSPAESEPGWGVNVTHQDNTLFATLFTYDATGRDLWLVMSAGQRQADGSYLGDLYRTTGPAFNANPFTPIGAGNLTTVGNMRFRFTDGNNGTLTYTYQGATVNKPITRQMFASPVPSCS